MKNYTATYEPETILCEPGWSYEVTCEGRPVFAGWTRGKKRDAEAEVRQGIKNRDAQLACKAVA